MTINLENRQTVGKIVALLFFIIGAICCLCGVCQSLSSLVQIQAGTLPPLQLPTGEVVDEAGMQRLAYLNLFMCAGIAFVLILFGMAVWYLFARKQPDKNLTAKAGMVFLFIASFGFFLVGIFSVIGFLSVGGMGLTDDALGVASAFFTFALCMVPAFLFALAGAAIWFSFVRGQETHPLIPSPEGSLGSTPLWRGD